MKSLKEAYNNLYLDVIRFKNLPFFKLDNKDFDMEVKILFSEGHTFRCKLWGGKGEIYVYHIYSKSKIMDVIISMMKQI